MVDELPLELDGVPTWLETPVTNVPPTLPPVQSRPQVLRLTIHRDRAPKSKTKDECDADRHKT
jgi:hypothetical protein